MKTKTKTQIEILSELANNCAVVINPFNEVESIRISKILLGFDLSKEEWDLYTNQLTQMVVYEYKNGSINELKSRLKKQVDIEKIEKTLGLSIKRLRELLEDTK